MHFAWRRGERGQRGMTIGGHERRRVKREGVQKKGEMSDRRGAGHVSHKRGGLA